MPSSGAHGGKDIVEFGNAEFNRERCGVCYGKGAWHSSARGARGVAVHVGVRRRVPGDAIVGGASREAWLRRYAHVELGAWLCVGER